METHWARSNCVDSIIEYKMKASQFIHLLPVIGIIWKEMFANKLPHKLLCLNVDNI